MIISRLKIKSTVGRHYIPRAYEYFKKTVAKYAEGNKSQSNDDLSWQINRIMKILSKVNAAQLVIIKADSSSSANALFEALNNRGEPLTITDLIKNRLLAALKEKYPSDFETYNKEWDVNIWKKIFIEDGKEIPGGEQERFFRQSYNAFRTVWIKDYPSELFSTGKRANLYELYEKIIYYDSLHDFEQIRECAKIYLRLQSNELDNTKLNKAYRDLNRINASTSYTLLLYMVKNRKSLNIDDDKKLKTFAIC